MLPKFLFHKVLGRPLWLWVLLSVTIAIIGTALLVEGAEAAPEEGKATINCALRVSYPTQASPYPALTGTIMRAGETVMVLWRGLPQDALLWGPSGKPADWVMVRTGRGAEGWVSNECFGWQAIVAATPTPVPLPTQTLSPVPQVGSQQPVQQPAFSSTEPSELVTQGMLATLDESCSIRPEMVGGSKGRTIASLNRGAQVGLTGYAGEGTCAEGTCSWVQVTDSTSGSSGVMHLSCIQGWQSLSAQFSSAGTAQSPSSPGVGVGVDSTTVPKVNKNLVAYDIGNGISIAAEKGVGAPFNPECFTADIIRYVGDGQSIVISYETNTPAWGETIPSRQSLTQLLGADGLRLFETKLNRKPQDYHQVIFSMDPDAAPYIPAGVSIDPYTPEFFPLALAHELEHIKQVNRGEPPPTEAQYEQNEVRTWRDAQAALQQGGFELIKQECLLPSGGPTP